MCCIIKDISLLCVVCGLITMVVNVKIGVHNNPIHMWISG